MFEEQGRDWEIDLMDVGDLRDEIDRSDLVVKDLRGEIDFLKSEVVRLETEMQTLTDALCDMVNQECMQPDGTLNSFHISSNSDSMRLLSDLGLLVIDEEYGRSVVGHWRGESNDST